MSLLTSIENILKKVKAPDEHFFSADIIRWAILNIFVTNLIPLKGRALHRINLDTDKSEIYSAIVSGIPEEYLIDETVNFPSDQELGAICHLLVDYRKKVYTLFKEHRMETILFILTSSHPLIKQTYRCDLVKELLSDEVIEAPKMEMSLGQVKTAVLNYVHYKDNRFWGLSWLFSSQESKTCFDQLWSQSTSDEKRYQIASSFIAKYPQKQFAICLAQILEGDNDKDPLIINVG